MAAGDSIKASYCDALALRSIIFQAEEKTDWGFFVVVFYRISKSHIDFFFSRFCAAAQTKLSFVKRDHNAS